MSTHKTPGRFVWRELMTTDVEAAKGFYGELFGWSFSSMEMGTSGTYWLVNVGGKPRGGIMKLPPNVPMTHWMSYVSVEDVDAAVGRAKAAGGQAPMGSMTMGGVGSMAVIMDPTGAATMAFCGDDPDPEVTRPGPGEFCWETLSTKDADAAKRFYGEVYGWKASSFGGAMTTFGVADGMEGQVADVQPAQPGMPSFWNTHVVVAKLSDAVARVEKLGGKVMMAEIDVPGIGKIGMVQDPQGAFIALFEPSAEMAG
jgi:predicted enzyme related to lactoylglutathione lyase